MVYGGRPPLSGVNAGSLSSLGEVTLFARALLALDDDGSTSTR